MLIDSHAHLNFPQLLEQIEGVLKRAHTAGVKKVICVGTHLGDSKQALELAQKYEDCYATAGLHPHDAKPQPGDIEGIKGLLAKPKVVAVGECGLDYYHQNSSKPQQEKTFRQQIELALELDMPLVFHVREAFSDFLRIVDSYPKLSGVVHSFSSNPKDAEDALARGYYVALNGIMTFTKDTGQLEAARIIPLDRLMLETDAPFLTPNPKRGKVNEPAYIREIAKFLANLRGESFEQLASATTQNTTNLFRL